ncbi:hypothetical protein TIFTF001_052217 [Ficus carica]|uniref:Uncharacterized protein n=1 Tax=Ficus carica TaxID=3494 RepID=A0AA88EF21_FICCA|nr:hypothetical protein TIFTF001_052217 [Ficus carica]
MDHLEIESGLAMEEIAIYLDFTSSIIGSVNVSYFFAVFLPLSWGVSGSKEITDGGISSEGIVVGAGNNIGCTSSLKLVQDMRDNSWISVSFLDRQYRARGHSTRYTVTSTGFTVHGILPANLKLQCLAPVAESHASPLGAHVWVAVGLLAVPPSHRASAE